MATPHSPCTLLSSAFPPIGKRASPSFKFQSSLRFLAAASFIQMKLHVAPVSVVDEARLFRSSGRLGIFPCNASPSSVSGKARPGINPELGSILDAARPRCHFCAPSASGQGRPVVASASFAPAAYSGGELARRQLVGTDGPDCLRQSGRPASSSRRPAAAPPGGESELSRPPEPGRLPRMNEP